MWSPVVGEYVVRNMAGIPMALRVTSVTDDRIYCGEPGVGWSFDRKTGAEVDEDLQWGPQFGVSGSCIVGILGAETNGVIPGLTPHE
jgi:hypothetical protein